VKRLIILLILLALTSTVVFAAMTYSASDFVNPTKMGYRNSGNPYLDPEYLFANEIEGYAEGQVAWPATLVNVEVVDANDVLTTAQSGSVLIYTGAHTVTLPEATAATVGVYYTIVDANATAAADLIIDPEGAGQINGDTAGNYIQNQTDADGCSCFIVCTGADTWYAVYTPSAWVEE
jgi:hypothetical protein